MLLQTIPDTLNVLSYATQAFLKDHFDDFFSLGQEAAGHQTPTRMPLQTILDTPKVLSYATQAFLEGHFDDFFSSDQEMTKLSSDRQNSVNSIS